ncbi:MAG: hypothetical protein P4L64_02485 [Caulobacteraceae bacterium]|nr:hypothetical protein [Caulobacteraceae bacterium]
MLHPNSMLQSWLIALALAVPASLAFGLTFYAFVERPCMARNWPTQLVNRMRGK